MLGELPPEPVSLYNRAVAGRSATSSVFDIDVSKASRLWLIVQENGSNDAEMVQPAWAQAELRRVVRRRAALVPDADRQCRRSYRRWSDPSPEHGWRRACACAIHPCSCTTSPAGASHAFTASWGWRTRRARSDRPSTRRSGSSSSTPSRTWTGWCRRCPGAPLPPPAALHTKAEAIDRVFWHLLGRAPSDAERRIADAALSEPSSGDRPSARRVGRFDLGVDDEAGVSIDLLSSESRSSVGWHRSSGDHETKTKDLDDVVGLVS